MEPRSRGTKALSPFRWPPSAFAMRTTSACAIVCWGWNRIGWRQRMKIYATRACSLGTTGFRLKPWMLQEEQLPQSMRSAFASLRAGGRAWSCGSPWRCWPASWLLCCGVGAYICWLDILVSSSSLAVQRRTDDLQREKVELERAREQMRHYAEHDDLTGLWNHRIII